MTYLIGFQDDRAFDPRVVGRKFSALADAARRGFPVPEALAVSTAAHRVYLATGSWPEGLRDEVLEAARGLSLRRGLSIRSSATREDGRRQSFAGQYQSFLEVDTEETLLQRIEACWASASSEIVGSYVKALNVLGSDVETPLMAVVIQRMVESHVAGVAFSRNPLAPGRDEMIIEAVRGHGDGLVSGHRTPCRAVVLRSGRIELEGRRRPRPKVARDTPWEEVARLLQQLEHAYDDAALDMEWAVDRRLKLWLLQVRPITTLAGADVLPPAGSWTRKIADDLWADRLTPFMAEIMLAHAPRFDLSAIARRVGIVPATPALAVVNGYLYVNCEGIRGLIALIPRPLRFKELQSLLPAGSRLEDIPAPSAWTLLRIGCGLARLPLSEPGLLPWVCLRQAPRNMERLRARMRTPARPAAGETSASELIEILRADLETLALIQENNQWPYSHATFFTWLLRGWAMDLMKLPGTEFLELLSRRGNNVTLRIEQWFRGMAARIAANREACERFRTEPAESLARSLPPELQKELDSFLSCYGCRSRHRTLAMKRWIEAPEEVIAILQSLVRHGHTGAMPPECRSREAVQAKFHHPLNRRVLKMFARLTGRFLDLREELRFLLDEVLLEIRRDLLGLGRHFGLGDSTLFLNPEEIERLAAGRLPLEEASRIAGERRERFIKPVEPCTFWVEGRPEYDLTIDGTVLRGIGTSPGRATGRAVIVSDPAAAAIRQGDVVVAQHTDPGWTPILSLVGGLVMEEGGLLNHCSIVARELGIPAVVGIRQATRLIPEGSRVTIDGGAGRVIVESS